MKYMFIFSALCMISLCSVKSQDIEFKKKNFSDAESFDQAVSNIKKGDEYFAKNIKWLYQQALEYYLKADEFNPNNSLINFKIGVCYLNSSNKAESLNYLLKAQSLNPDVDSKLEFAIAQGYHYNLQFDEAIIHYRNAMKALNIKSSNKKLEKITSFVMIIEKRIAECESGKLLIANSLKVEIENLGAVVNSKYTDYVSLVTSNENQMFFTSRREGSTGGEIDQDGLEYFEDVYQSLRNQEKWGKSQKMEGSINTSSHDASVGLSADGKKLFIYRGLVNGGDLYECEKEGLIWLAPKSISSINTTFHETSACITSDGKTLYLTSDRQDKTIGMRDVFVSHLDSNGNWSEPENLGTTINTPNDEEGVSLSNDENTLYFSSTGHNTMGGFDMFKSTFQNGKWSSPENLGYPLNTPDDEMYIQVFGEKDFEHGYYSAIRKEGIGSMDIYYFKLIQEQAALKNAADNSENPENYRVPVDSGDPANLFVNVSIDSIANINNIIQNNENKVVNNDESNDEKKEVNKDYNIVQNKDKNNIANKPIENVITESIIASENVVYKVQVGACHRQIPQAELHQRYPGKKDIYMETHEGWYKYLIGNFDKYNEAKNEKITCGTNDAWVVVYKDGKRVPIIEVVNMLSYNTYSKLIILMLL